MKNTPLNLVESLQRRVDILLQRVGNIVLNTMALERDVTQAHMVDEQILLAV